MTRTRKLWIASALVILAMTIALCWPRPRGYTYQGKTVEQWFEEFMTLSPWNGPRPSWDPATVPIRHAKPRKAFQEMGTNAVPFLASRITRDLQPTRLEEFAVAGRFVPRHRYSEAQAAAYLLGNCIRPPESMLRELLEPALLSTNVFQKGIAELALTRWGPLIRRFETNSAAE